MKLSISVLFVFALPLFVFGQCITGNCANGKGKVKYPNQSTYQGSFKKGKAHGKGTLVLVSGERYIGEFHQGYKQGTGKQTMRTGGSYIGAFSKDLFQGRGKYTYANGDVYKGEWSRGVKNGRGVYEFNTKEVYEGEFSKDKINGKGKITFSDGSYKEGNWLDGKLIQEFYREEPAQTAITSTTEIAPTVSEALANCNKQKCDDIEGRYTYGDGSIYEGHFINGSPQGEGICYYANGSQYQGGWKSHGPHGIGMMTFESGKKYNAEWNYGHPIKEISNDYVKEDHQKFEQDRNRPFDPDVKIYALIAGVANYKHMPSLKYTDDDAYQVYAFLKSPAGGAVPDDQIEMFVDDAATKSNITYGLRDISSRADANDVILVYLSGHGLQGSYIPSDFDGYNNNLAYSELLSIIDDSDAKHKLCIADACHSGSMYAAKGVQFQGLESYYGSFDQLQGGTAFLTSSKSEELSLEYSGLRQGVFSHFLIKGLKGAADHNGNSNVTLQELYDYVFKSVQSYTANTQSPTLSGNYNPDMPVGVLYSSL